MRFADPVSFPYPFPPPLSALFIKHRGGGGVPSKRYESYAIAAEAAWYEAGRPRITGPVALRFDLHPPDRVARDLGNMHKALLDSLVNLRIIEGDDCKVVMSEQWFWVPEGPPLVVTITPLRQTFWDRWVRPAKSPKLKTR